MSASNKPADTSTAPRKANVLPLVAMAISVLATLFSIGCIWVSAGDRHGVYASDAPTVAAPDPVPLQPEKEGVDMTYRELQKYLAKGRSDTKSWGKQHHLGKAKSASVALAYLCLANKPSREGRYYAAGTVDEEQFFGIGPYGTRKGDPKKTARSLCPTPPSWTKK